MGSFFSSLFDPNPAGIGPGGSPESSRVHTFHSSDRWQLHFNEHKDSPALLVIFFSASWCGPCRSIEPVIHAMADKFTDVVFNKIDVDELPDVVKEFEVQAMPTFVFVKKGKEVARVVGAKKDELVKNFEQLRA